MESAFIGRKEELDVIKQIWDSPQAALLILYGRRRVGKTRLLTHWMQAHEDSGLYWMAPATSALDQLRSFSQALMDFSDPEAPIPEDFTYATWELALHQAALLGQGKKIALFIDEVTYLMEVTPSIIGTLQKAWDQWLSKSNVVLALSGSQMGLMQREILAYKAPLYGRANAQLKLPPLPFGVTNQFFPNYSVRDRVAIYGIWGGIPAYWERLNPDLTVMENLQNQLRPASAWMLDEPRTLLQDFINDPYNYVGVIRAIAHGAHTLSDISKRSGLSGGPASKYLSVLRDTGFVERRIPVMERSSDSRRGRYFITDPYLRFFYRFLAAFQSKLALGKLDQTMQQIENGLPQFIAANTWQELCREWVLLASAENRLPVAVEEVGSEWKRTYAFDVVGVSYDAHTLVVGNCHWQDEPEDIESIHEMVRRTSSIIPDGEEWSVYYVGFSAAGWTSEAIAEAEEVVMSGRAGRGRKKWHPVGIRLLDLEQLDADLAKWSTN
ncbi:MAG: ATP-binding protein [Chloroflexi bacterium]|nr:ATP-binding protein [Chloroflexota bacterium]